MAKNSGDRDSGHWMEGVRGIFALLLSSLLSTARHLLSCLQGGQTASMRGRGVPLDESWKDLGDALAMPSASGDLLISPNIDPEGQYNVRLELDQLRAIRLQDPAENIDADNAAAAEADLDMWLAVAEVASLPRQIERDEANMIVRRPQVPSSVAESGVTPSSLVDDVAAGAPQHQPPQAPLPETVAADAPAPDVVGIPVGILAGVVPQQIEDKARDAETQVEVAIESFPPGMLELISDIERLPQFATPSMAVPGGELQSNLEERVPVDHPEAGDPYKLSEPVKFLHK